MVSSGVFARFFNHSSDMPIQLTDDPIPPQVQGPSPPGPRAGETRAETIDRMSAEMKVAKMAQTAAERQVRELKDVVRAKDLLKETSTAQCAAAWEMVAELQHSNAEKDVIIARLKSDAEHFPLSTPALMRSHHLLSSTFDTLRECFTCPLCYDGLAKASAISLQCGHTFCEKCILTWTRSRRPASLAEPPGKTLANVECPECRLGTADPTARRVRLYMLEEAVRLLARAERERAQVEVEEAGRREKLQVVEGSDLPSLQPGKSLKDKGDNQGVSVSTSQ